MSDKPIIGCDGKPALHPDGRPVVMESPCPWVPWTWAVREGYAATIQSPNPGPVLTVRLPPVAGSLRVYLDTRVIWSCGKTGLIVSAAFTSDFPGEIIARAVIGGIGHTSLTMAGGMGPFPVAGSDYFYYRFPVSVSIDGSADDIVTLTFAWY